MSPVKHKKRGILKGSPPVRDAARVGSQSAPPSAFQPAPLSASGTSAKVGLLSAIERAHSPAPPSVTPAEPSSPSLTATDLAGQLHSAAIHLLRRLRVRDRESGIGPAQLSALSVLVFGGPKSLGELADAEQVRRPTMSRIVAGLERSGLVRRHATEDGRRIRLEATLRGGDLMSESRRRRVESLAQAVFELSEGERQQLSETLTLLQQVIRKL
jgi:DNA-binding MarR family transcriptional regulator